MHKIFIKKWKECKFGVKERVKNDFSSRVLHYVLTTPTYNDENKIREIIKSIEFHASEIEREIKIMNNKINKIV
jgi:peptidyl-tRNA hydrolase